MFDFSIFHEQVEAGGLEIIKPSSKILAFIENKYPDAYDLSCHKISKGEQVVHFKHKLWYKMSIFKNGEWEQTRVCSLKNRLADPTMEVLNKSIKKTIKIIRIESVIPAYGDFFFYIICKISGKKKVLHVSKEGEVLLNIKYVDYKIHLEENEEDELQVDLVGEEDMEE